MKFPLKSYSNSDISPFSWTFGDKLKSLKIMISSRDILTKFLINFQQLAKYPCLNLLLKKSNSWNKESRTSSWFKWTTYNSWNHRGTKIQIWHDQIWATLCECLFYSCFYCFILTSITHLLTWSSKVPLRQNCWIEFRFHHSSSWF